MKFLFQNIILSTIYLLLFIKHKIKLEFVKIFYEFFKKFEFHLKLINIFD